LEKISLQSRLEFKNISPKKNALIQGSEVTVEFEFNDFVKSDSHFINNDERNNDKIKVTSLGGAKQVKYKFVVTEEDKKDGIIAFSITAKSKRNKHISIDPISISYRTIPKDNEKISFTDKNNKKWELIFIKKGEFFISTKPHPEKGFKYERAYKFCNDLEKGFRLANKEDWESIISEAKSAEQQQRILNNDFYVDKNSFEWLENKSQLHWQPGSSIIFYNTHKSNQTESISGIPFTFRFVIPLKVWQNLK